MNFDDLFQHICRQLKKLDFEVAVEDDYPDFKNLFADHKQFREDIFRMVDIVLSDNGDVHFVFHTRKGRYRQRDLTTSDFSLLKSFIDELFSGSGFRVREYDDIRRRYPKAGSLELRDPEATVLIEVHGGFSGEAKSL